MPPTKVADKPVARSGKRDASGTAPSEARGGAGSERGGRGGRRGGAQGNEQGMFGISGSQGIFCLHVPVYRKGSKARATYSEPANFPLHIAFRDREAGSMTNRGKPTDDGVREDRHSNQFRGNRGGYEGRGGRGGRGARGGRGGGRDDRHTRGPPKYVPLRQIPLLAAHI